MPRIVWPRRWIRGEVDEPGGSCLAEEPVWKTKRPWVLLRLWRWVEDQRLCLRREIQCRQTDYCPDARCDLPLTPRFALYSLRPGRKAEVWAWRSPLPPRRPNRPGMRCESRSAAAREHLMSPAGTSSASKDGSSSPSSDDMLSSVGNNGARAPECS